MIFEPLFKWFQEQERFFIEIEDRADTDSNTCFVAEVIFDAVVGDELELRKIDRMTLRDPSKSDLGLLKVG